METCSCGKPCKSVPGFQSHQRLTGHTGTLQVNTGKSPVDAPVASPVAHRCVTCNSPVDAPVNGLVNHQSLTGKDTSESTGNSTGKATGTSPVTSTGNPTGNPTGELVALSQEIKRLSDLLEGDSLAMCQDENCPACEATDLHQAYQLGGVAVEAWYEGIPGVPQLREAIQLARAKIRIVA